MKNSSQNYPASERILKKLYSAARAVIKEEGSKGDLCITITDDARIRRLNKKYRRIDRATDVLSFEMRERGMLGDIVISVDSAKRNAKRFGVTFGSEVGRLAVHGALHLLGFDHSKKIDRDRMRKIEDAYLTV